MNLVAKEYVAAQAPDDPGVLILSRFAGAAEELDGALLVNPYDIERVCETIQTALELPLQERINRWHRMMEQIDEFNLERWSNNCLDAIREPLKE